MSGPRWGRLEASWGLLGVFWGRVLGPPGGELEASAASRRRKGRRAKVIDAPAGTPQLLAWR
eukprot:9164197-Pyramimonas_sp.AAC.1